MDYREVMDRIKREDFVAAHQAGAAAVDEPVSIGFGQTNSQPKTVQIMLDLLAPESGEKILDVGSGSGWTTAILGEITGPTGVIIGVEIVPDLVKTGKTNIAKYPMPWVKIYQSGNVLGWPPEAPYKRILVSASAKELPAELLSQLEPGGRMVIPIKESVWQVDKMADGSIEQKEFPGFTFVPLI